MTREAELRKEKKIVKFIKERLINIFNNSSHRNFSNNICNFISELDGWENNNPPLRFKILMEMVKQ